MIYHLLQVTDGFSKLVNPASSAYTHLEQRNVGRLLVHVSVTVQTIILSLEAVVLKVRNIIVWWLICANQRFVAFSFFRG
jgi:hypothetical protein